MTSIPPNPIPDQKSLDRAWYLARYADIDPHTDPAAHYHVTGWRQFRDPAPWFSTAAYLTAHPDVAEAGVDPLEHWLHYGQAEGRAIFDADTPLDLVRPRGAPGDLMALADTVEAAARDAAAAGRADTLQALTRFLLGQLDVAVRATAGLAADDAARAARLAQAVEGWSLPGLLHAAADDTIARYPALSLPELDHPDVTVIVPAFGQFATTYACLESLLAHPGRAGFEIVLVDDASVDETVFASFVLHGGIRILRQPRNAGFVGAVNAAAATARGRLLLLLNNDTLVQPGWLDALVDTLDAEPSIGIVGARLLGVDGMVQDCGGVVWRDGGACNLGRGGDPNDPAFCRLREVDYVSGAALMLSRQLFQTLGGLDPAYAPGYYEDTDLCFRVRDAGLRVVVQPASTIVHLEGVTAGRSVQGGGMKRYQERNRALFQRRWAAVLPTHPEPGAARALDRYEPLTALFIDETTPTPDRDAGSNAARSHMRALQRLGYAVQFVPSHNMARQSGYTDALERAGILCHRAPWSGSVESVLKQCAGRLALVYLHRLHSAVQYTGLVRRHCPDARILFGVADLHHLRTAREAAVTNDPALAEDASRLRIQELAAARAVDAVIIHSTAEAAILAREAPEIRCVTIPWVIEPQPIRTPFADRTGIAFVGGFNHHPNPDAVEWLVDAIMPLVWQRSPGLELLLIGADMPARILAMARPGIRVLGHVPDLASALSRVRLTVSPLRFGAGLKGKVLTSLAFGLPCVMSEIAAEGMALPPGLASLVCRTADDHAAAILALHDDETRAAALTAESLAWIGRTFAPARIDGLLREAIHPPAPAAPLPDPPRPTPRPPTVRRRAVFAGVSPSAQARLPPGD